MILNDIKSTLHDLANADKAKILSRYFKTGKGEYGEGDQFLGITVPDQRLVAKEFYQTVSLDEIKNLLSFDIHEYRLTALLMLVLKYEKTKDTDFRKEIVEKLEITDGGRLSSNLNALISSDFIMKYVPFGYGKREEHYKLVDPFCIF